MTRPLPEPYETTEILKDRIRACRTRRQLTDVSAEIAPAATAHEPLDPGGIAQLRHLIRYQRMCIRNGWIGADSVTQQEMNL